MTLTFQKFFRVNGGSTQLKGIVPDIILPDPYEYYKVREKDMPEALPWDEIPRAQYEPWGKRETLDAIIAKENKAISSNPNFNLLKDNLIWLSKNNEMPPSLQLDAYQKKQKQIQQTVSQNNTLLTLPGEMTIEYMESEKDKFLNHPDKSKSDFYAAWIKSLRKDLQIEEGVRVISQLADAEKNTLVKNR
jgi:carboxyl-terminal processing protease